ncbi:DUF3515 domain-containing protein [Streptomyces sp. QH1-20]|uniref:DUF3515 domain-containing protein n=1 Tax=Streptomyces sp. QH1-20 TaxID=3240934 RepID=UPI0035165181
MISLVKALPRRWLGLPVIAALLAAVGCSATNRAASDLPAPTPTGQQAAHCSALHTKLPATLEGMKRHALQSDSDFIAAWGEPTITLQCGVSRPLIVTPGYKRYNPYAPTIEIGGVEWLPEEQPDGSVRCTTSKREAWVEVTATPKYAKNSGEFGMLTGLSDVVAKTVPYGTI